MSNLELMNADTVHDAIQRVMAAVPYVKKSKTAGLNYSFASEAELIKQLHGRMCDNSLDIHPTRVTPILNDSYTTKTGAQMFRVRLAVAYRMTHAPSNTHIDIETAGEASDNGDKAVAKALTIALKYALRQCFLIETGDDPDRVKSEDAAGKKANKTASLIERGQESLDKCRTPDEVRELMAKFGAVKSPGDKSELLVRADRKLKQLEATN